MNTPIPMPVEPLTYETPGQNEWRPIIRALGIIGVVSASLTFVEAALPFLSGLNSPAPSPKWVADVFVRAVYVLDGLAAVGMLVASVQFLRRVDANMLMLASATTIVWLTALRSIGHCIQIMTIMSSSGGVTIWWGSLATNFLFGIHLAILPAAIVMVVRGNAKRHLPKRIQTDLILPENL